MPQKGVHFPAARTTRMRSLMQMAPWGMIGNLPCDVDGATWPPSLDHSEEDVSSPWYAVKWIKRTS